MRVSAALAVLMCGALALLGCSSASEDTTESAAEASAATDRKASSTSCTGVRIVNHTDSEVQLGIDGMDPYDWEDDGHPGMPAAAGGFEGAIVPVYDATGGFTKGCFDWNTDASVIPFTINFIQGDSRASVELGRAGSVESCGDNGDCEVFERQLHLDSGWGLRSDEFCKPLAQVMSAGHRITVECLVNPDGLDRGIHTVVSYY